MKNLDELSFDRIPVSRFRIGCLSAMALITLLSIVMGSSIPEPVRQFALIYFSVPAALMLGAALREPMSRLAKGMLLLGTGFCVWTALLQIYDFRYFSLQHFYSPRYALCAFFAEYMVLLPFGSMADEKQKATGMKIAGGFFLAASLIMCVYAALLSMDLVPSGLEGVLRWEGSRLALGWHPNITAVVFMIGIAMCLAFISLPGKLWWKILLGCAAAAEMFLLLLTNSRAVVAMTCCILGGVVFLLVYQQGNWKRLLVMLLVAALVVGLLFIGGGMLYKAHSHSFAERNELSEETVASNSGQRSLWENLPSFNGRTGIWKGALEAIRDNPKVLVIGTREVGELISPYNSFDVQHAHNAWMQALLSLGLVGFLFVLAITWLAVRSALQLFFFRKSTMFQKTIGLLVIAMMGAEFFEPYLFYTVFPWNFMNVVFMLCTGYLVYWAANTEKRS